MNQAINRGFDDEAEYRKVSNLLFRYARNKVEKAKIWRPDVHDYKSRDIVTDAILDYLKQVEKGSIIDHKISYIRKIINGIIIKEAINEKATKKESIMVFNSAEDSIEKASFIMWERAPNADFLHDHEPDVLHISNLLHDDVLQNNFSKMELKIINLLNQGFKNREIAKMLAYSEGYVSKLVKNLRVKISQIR